MNQDEILAQFNKWWNEDDDIPNDAPWQQDSMIQFAWAGYNAAIQHYKDSVLNEVGEPVAARRKVAMWQGGDDYKYEWAVVKEHTPGTEPLYTSDQVAAAVAKAEKRIAELDADLVAARQIIDEENKDHIEQLAASQLRETQLREALQTYIDEHEECQDADDWMAMMCSIEAHHVADEALSLPTDTSALDAFVAEKVKEAESFCKEEMQRSAERNAKLRKQRDLAVEALQFFMDHGICGATYYKVREAISTIKDSENNQAS